MQNNVLLKHFYLYMQVRGEQNYIKVYSIVFTYDHGSPHKFTVSPVKKVRYIEDCLNMWPHKFIHFENSTVEFYRTFADIFKDENVLLQRKDILKSNQNIINEVLETEPRKIDLHSYLNFKSHKHMMVDAEFQDSILVQDSSRNHFRLFLGKECVFEFSLKDESFRHKVVEGETCEVVGVAEGVFRVECTKKDGTRRFMHLDKSIPIIDDSFLVSVLRVFLSVYDSKIYHALVRDLILNCLVRLAYLEF